MGTINSNNIKVRGKNVISHGDRIKVYNPSANGYLNKTDSGSGNRPSTEFHGWTFWRKRADADSNFVIHKG